ncbi:MAG: hypothetical protein JW871_07665 [Endomicrobiales bacterium]|nr:hypothetical protein [Endomicrobiales bacterium]
MRKIIYLSVLLICVLGVIIKAGIIREKDKKEIININSEWAKYGKPVDVFSVKRGDLYVRQNISGVLKYDNVIEADVDGEIAAKLEVGQKILTCIGEKGCEGEIVYVSGTRDLISGLYKVRVKINQGVKINKGAIVVAQVVIGKYSNVIYMPKSAVVINNGGKFCWVVKDSIVKKKFIKTGISNGSYVQVVSGLNIGDAVCVNGIEELEEGSAVRIRKTETL